MVRKLFSVVVVLTLIVGIGISVADHRIPVAKTKAIALVPRGDRPCFGIGSPYCCREIATVGILGGFVGNPYVAGLAGLYWLYRCSPYPK